VRWSSRSRPCSAEVTVRAPGFCTPRSDMHMCSGLEDDTDALWREMLLDPPRDLSRKALLHLQGAREQVHDAGEL
jgi:hypothetical protein